MKDQEKEDKHEKKKSWWFYFYLFFFIFMLNLFFLLLYDSENGKISLAVKDYFAAQKNKNFYNMLYNRKNRTGINFTEIKIREFIKSAVVDKKLNILVLGALDKIYVYQYKTKKLLYTLYPFEALVRLEFIDNKKLVYQTKKGYYVYYYKDKNRHKEIKKNDFVSAQVKQFSKEEKKSFFKEHKDQVEIVASDKKTENINVFKYKSIYFLCNGFSSVSMHTKENFSFLCSGKGKIIAISNGVLFVGYENKIYFRHILSFFYEFLESLEVSMRNIAYIIENNNYKLAKYVDSYIEGQKKVQRLINDFKNEVKKNRQYLFNLYQVIKKRLYIIEDFLSIQLKNKDSKFYKDYLTMKKRLIFVKKVYKKYQINY